MLPSLEHTHPRPPKVQKPAPNMAQARSPPICLVSLMKLSVKALKRQDLASPKAPVLDDALQFTSATHYLTWPSQHILSLPFTIVI